MKYLIIIFSLLVFNGNELKAQNNNVYPLHPSVGDTIDQFEKLDYSLFPEIPNDEFNFAFISIRQDSFFLNHSVSNQMQQNAISQLDLITAQKNIEKVNAYFRFKAADTLKNENLFNDNNKKPIQVQSALSNQSKKELRMQLRLKEDAIRMREREQGFRPNEIRIEFK